MRILAGLTLLVIPVNWATYVWANRSVQGTTQCNAPLTWDQRTLGIYIPLAFVALALGCLVAAIVMYVRTRKVNPRPMGLGTVGLALIGLIAAMWSGFLVALRVGFINWCF